MQQPFSNRVDWSAGQPIGDLMARALHNPQLISLAAGFVDQQSLPVAATQAAFQALGADKLGMRAALQYGTTRGDHHLRERLLHRFLSSDFPEGGVGVDIDQIVVTAGSNQLLHLLADTLLNPGDIVLCAAPSYLVFLGIVATCGARSVGVATDDHGLVPEALDTQLSHLHARGELSRVKAVYVVPYFDNPCGVTLSVERRAEIVEIVQRWSHGHRIHVIEDAAYRELRFAGPDVPSLRTFDPEGKTVIVTDTFSKQFSPGIRVGWGLLPADLVQPVCQLKDNLDFGSPNLNQQLMCKVMELNLLPSHVNDLRRGYMAKRDAMLDACQSCLASIPGMSWIRPQGGLYVWATLPEEMDTGPSGSLFDAAIEEGVFYVPGEYFYPKEGALVRKNTMRLSFGVQTPVRIAEGIAALSRAIQRVS